MENFGNLLTLAGAVFGIIGLAALAIAYFRAQYTEQTLKLLRQDRDDANARADGIRDDFEIFKEKANLEKRELQDKILQYETRDSQKSQEIHTLRNIVTGKEQLETIHRLLLSISERIPNDTPS